MGEGGYQVYEWFDGVPYERAAIRISSVVLTRLMMMHMMYDGSTRCYLRWIDSMLLVMD